jgi:S1-C subfamily serine protease
MSHSAVVRVYATTQDPDYECPWQTDSPDDSTGSGVVIGPGQVLTGAHVVANATFIQVQKISEPDKYPAKIHSICHDADLALLEVPAEAFMTEIEPAHLGAMPEQRDRVAVVGFPVGGDEISISEGVVSRIEVQRYSHSQRRLLAVTVDAAINEGNSGGPVMDADGKVVGIAFQALEDAENLGEMVPTTVIQRFFDGIDQGRDLVIPGFGAATQNLENPMLRRVLGMGNRDSGLLVEGVDYGSSAWDVLEPGDVLLELAGNPIANNGTITYRNRYRTSFEAVLGEHFVGDDLPVTILRNGHRRHLTMHLLPYRPLVCRDQYDRRPRWFVFGGLVFQVLTRDFLKTWDRWWRAAPKALLSHYDDGVRSAEQREIVVLSEVLADEVNVGYSHFCYQQIVNVNGHRPVDFRDLVSRIDSCDDLVDLRTAGGDRIVLDAQVARAAGPRILERYQVPSDRSADL